MIYNLTITEIDEIKEEEDFIICSEEYESKKVEVFENENEIVFSVEEDVEIENEHEEYAIYKKVNNISKVIEIKKETNKISNLQEIRKKWDELKSELLYNTTTSGYVIDNLMSAYDYFENEKALELALERYGIIPFLINIDMRNLDENNDLEKELKLYGVLARRAMIYKVKYNIEKEIDVVKIIYSGKGDIDINDYNLNKEIRGIIKLPKDKNFFVASTIVGEYIFSNKLEKMDVNIKFVVEEMKDLKKYKFAEKNIFISFKEKDGEINERVI